MANEALIAAIRFGLGPRPDQPSPADPMAWLERQLAAPDRPPIPADHEKPPGLAEAFAAQRADREAQQQGQPRTAVTALFRAEAQAAMANAITTEAPFRERLVLFWANHFTVSRRDAQVGPLAGCYVRDAIRPHVTGRFGDMLLAVARHPAMLAYLNNAVSVGPNSPAGQRGNRGLNENLAREILELHTLSPAGGYTQADVTSFAAILTGWSFESQREPVGFLFRPRAHEPGPKTLMGRSYEEGEAGGLAALAWLAEQPATYRFIATKLARHFVADAPPPKVVEALFRVLRDSHGDLGATSRALIKLREPWEAPLSKVRPPLDVVVASLRALGLGAQAAPQALGALNQLGQPMWAARGPNGWPDLAPSWAAPEALLRRAELAWGLAGRAAVAHVDPLATMDLVLGPLAGEATRHAVRGAGSVRESLTLLIASPEFQRR